MHGYDVVDPTVLNPELGTDEDYREFIRTLQAHDMGHVLDVVPNHMGIAQSANAWWRMCWRTVSAPACSPVRYRLASGQTRTGEQDSAAGLGDLYGTVLENQEIMLVYEEGRFLIRYYDHRLPIAPESSVLVLHYRLDELIAQAGASSPPVQEWQSIYHGPPEPSLSHGSRSPACGGAHREKEIIRQRLATLVRESSAIAGFLNNNIRLFNGVKGDPQLSTCWMLCSTTRCTGWPTRGGRGRSQLPAVLRHQRAGRDPDGRRGGHEESTSSCSGS